MPSFSWSSSAPVASSAAPFTRSSRTSPRWISLSACSPWPQKTRQDAVDEDRKEMGLDRKDAKSVVGNRTEWRTLVAECSSGNRRRNRVSSPWPAITYTHPFNGPLSGTTWVSRHQKGKTNLDFTEARDSERQWHQLGHMQICTSLQRDNHASTPPLSFFAGRMPFLSPNEQRQRTFVASYYSVNKLHSVRRNIGSFSHGFTFTRHKIFNNGDVNRPSQSFARTGTDEDGL